MRFAALIAVALVASCSNIAPTVTPAGSPLTIQTAPARSGPLGGGEVCALAALLPVVISRDGDVLTFLGASSRQPVAIVWPHGFSARLVDGKGQLLDPSGAMVGKEGDTLSDLGGGIGSDSDAFGVCSIGGRVY